MTWLIRAGQAAEAEILQEIEQAAASRFAAVGLGWLVDHPNIPLADFERAAQGGRLLVAAEDATDRPLGFLFPLVLDGQLHIRELDVRPGHWGRGIGRALIQRAADMARAEGRGWLTLTTFRDVPWNAPYYAHLGFAIIPPAEIGPDLSELIEAERRAGLMRAPRLAMRRSVGDQARSSQAL